MADANGATGFSFSGTGHKHSGNVAVGNKGPGISTFTNSSVTISGNNIYGNNLVSFGEPTNCGLVNNSWPLVTAINNFCGAASGSGSDPSGEVCGDTAVIPFAAKEFKIRMKPSRIKFTKVEVVAGFQLFV